MYKNISVTRTAHAAEFAYLKQFLCGKSKRNRYQNIYRKCKQNAGLKLWVITNAHASSFHIGTLASTLPLWSTYEELDKEASPWPQNPIYGFSRIATVGPLKPVCRRANWWLFALAAAYAQCTTLNSGLMNWPNCMHSPVRWLPNQSYDYTPWAQHTHTCGGRFVLRALDRWSLATRKEDLPLKNPP